MMRKIVCLRLLPLLFMAACAQTPDEDAGALRVVSFSVIPSVGEDPAGAYLAGTRARVDGGAFAVQSQVGLGINSVDNATMSNVYKNFFARYNGTDWLYYLGGVSNGTLLSGFAAWGNINIYGYYPYDIHATNLAEVPFSIASTTGGGVWYATDSEAQTDYMVAASKSKNLNDPATATDIVSLEFAHLMTAIEFKVRRKDYNTLPVIKLDKVVYKINGGGRKFGIAGSYNAIDPDMNNISANLDITGEAEQLEVSYPNSANITSITYSSRLLIIFPELRLTTGSGQATDNDATVTLTFHFADQDGNPYAFEEAENPEVTFKLSDIANSGNDKGLLAGYTYTLEATIGTYTKFSAPFGGPTIVNEELDDTEEPVFIEI